LLLVVLSCGLVLCVVFFPVRSLDSDWLLFSRPAIWLDWVHYSSKCLALVAQAAAWSPVISLTGAALSPLFSSQALSRSDFSHPPVLQQTALSYCLESHFSPVNQRSVIIAINYELSSNNVWDVHLIHEMIKASVCMFCHHLCLKPASLIVIWTSNMSATFVLTNWGKLHYNTLHYQCWLNLTNS